MHEVDNNTIFSIIKTLKEMDVRGYDSMNRLVGLVMLFESILNEPEKGQDNGTNEANVC